MFKIVREPTFTHPVNIMTPLDGGKFKPETCRATYRVIGAEESLEFDLNTVEGANAFLRRSITRVDDLVDDANQPLAYSDELREILLQTPYVRHALLKTYVNAVSKAPTGN